MIRTEDVIAFFDRLAPHWDADMIRDDAIIGAILDNAFVTAGKTVLDVACGTGVLIPDYLARGVKHVTAVDISPNMAKIAREKFADDPRVTVLTADVETVTFDGMFDCVVVYNAFPHFPAPARLIARLSGLVRPGGTLTVAHGMSRARINTHHSGAMHVSLGLMAADELAALFRQTLTVTTVLSDDRMYQVVGRRSE